MYVARSSGKLYIFNSTSSLELKFNSLETTHSKDRERERDLERVAFLFLAEVASRHLHVHW